MELMASMEPMAREEKQDRLEHTEKNLDHHLQFPVWQLVRKVNLVQRVQPAMPVKKVIPEIEAEMEIPVTLARKVKRVTPVHLDKMATPDRKEIPDKTPRLARKALPANLANVEMLVNPVTLVNKVKQAILVSKVQLVLLVVPAMRDVKAITVLKVNQVTPASPEFPLTGSLLILTSMFQRPRVTMIG